ncbi:DUF6965 family protein [Dyadobacter sp. CY323]|uniref:DUF6965 family protein n=1 Tax=Dyadobacter sp. CY323 TaxID=2907302 RepID=UPI0038D3947A
MTIAELKEWYEGKELPTGSIMINQFRTIGDAKRFVDLEFEVLTEIQILKRTTPVG